MRAISNPCKIGLMGVAGALAAMGSASAIAAEIAGKTVSVTGKVLVRSVDGGETSVRTLRSGDAVLKGSIINTSSNSAVKLLMTDKTILDLGSSTLFKIDEYKLNSVGDRQVQVSMEYGKIRASVNRPVGAAGKFNVKTKSATMGVRGTEFIVASTLSTTPAKPDQDGPTMSGRGLADSASKGAGAPTSDQTQVTVVHGKVVVDTQQAGSSRPSAPVALTAGNQLTATSGDGIAKSDPPKVTQLSQQELMTAKQEAKPQDTTFVQAVAIEPSSGGSEGSDGPRQKGAPGSSTLAAISETLASAGAPQIEVGPPTGIPGTFGADFGMTGPLNPPPSGLVNLRVVFKTSN